MSINSLCYLGLGFISIILLSYVCYKTEVRRALLTFMAMVGLGYIIEAVIYNLLDSYQYYPKIIKHDPVYDSNLGAIASNALSLPAVATYLAAFRKTWLWFVVMIGLFAGIEWTFLELHIYKHHWWKIGYTSLGLPVYFILAKILYKKLAQPLKGLSHTLVLYIIVSPFAGTFHILPIMLFSNRYYKLGLFANHSKDTTAFGALFYLSTSLFYVAIVKRLFIPRWLKYMVTALSMYSATIILKKMGILYGLVWWDIWYYVGLSCISLRYTEFISKRLSTGS